MKTTDLADKNRWRKVPIKFSISWPFRSYGQGLLIFTKTTDSPV